MRILHVITSLRTGGAEKLMVDLLPRLKAAGHEVDLLLFDGVDTPFRREAEGAGIRIYDMGTGGSVYSPVRLLRLIPYLRHYDVVHTHNTAPQLFAAIGSLFPGSRATLVTTEHNTSNRRRKWSWYARIDRWMYNRYKRVICISQKTEDKLREFIGSSRAEIGTINNGVDVAHYAVARLSTDLEDIASGSRKIVMVAGFRWEKDQDTLIRAVASLPGSFHLFLVGDGVRRPQLEELIARLGVGDRVHLLGLRYDVPELLHAADYIVTSSHIEGFGLAAVEGMSVGRPFLASDVDGLREVVAGAGILFPHEDAESLAAAITRLEACPDEYRSVSEACRARAALFDISKMADRYSQVYTSL